MTAHFGNLRLRIVSVKIKDSSINFEKQAEYLGVSLDSKLSLSHHTDSFCKELGEKCAVFLFHVLYDCR